MTFTARSIDALKAYLRTAAVLHELFIDELTVPEAVIYAGEFIALALISQMLYVVENAVPHNYLIGLFQHILYLFVELIELGLSAEILFRISKFYLRSALFSSQIKTRSGIHHYVFFFKHVELLVRDYIAERTNLSLSVKTIGTFHIVK